VLCRLTAGINGRCQTRCDEPTKFMTKFCAGEQGV